MVFVDRDSALVGEDAEVDSADPAFSRASVIGVELPEGLEQAEMELERLFQAEGLFQRGELGRNGRFGRFRRFAWSGLVSSLNFCPHFSQENANDVWLSQWRGRRTPQ